MSAIPTTDRAPAAYYAAELPPPSIHELREPLTAADIDKAFAEAFALLRIPTDDRCPHWGADMGICNDCGQVLLERER